jgi:hypothetical protein
MGEFKLLPPNRLYKELISNLEVIKAEMTEKKSIEASEFCDKEIRKNLVDNGYEPDITVI